MRCGKGLTMDEFFTPWRRRIGVVALQTAFLFVYGWIRSSKITDQLEIAAGDYIRYFTSTRGYLQWTRHAERQVWTPSLNWHSMANGSPGQPLDRNAGLDWQWRSDWYVFDFGRGQLRGSSLAVLTFSYLIGIPLPGVAAALLILAPRLSTQKKTVELTPETVA